MRVLDLSYHPLDVRSGGWVDLSRFGNHGIPHGGARPVMIAPGVMGYWFDGSSGYVDCGSDSSICGAFDELSAFVWFNKSVVPDSNRWLFVSMRSTGGYRLGFCSSGQLIARLRDDAGNLSPGLSGGSSVDGKWHFGGFTYKKNGNFLLYLDSWIVDSSTWDKPIGPQSPLFLGHSDYFVGYCRSLMAQLIIENRAWSEAEVRENMYRSPIYAILRGLPYSVYIKVPWKQTQGGIYVP